MPFFHLILKRYLPEWSEMQMFLHIIFNFFNKIKKKHIFFGFSEKTAKFVIQM